MSVRDRDRGYKALLKRLEDSGKKTVTVGIHEEEGAAQHGDEGPSVAEIGEINEFGLGVPERSFIRAWVDENTSANDERLRKLATGVVKGTVASAEQALDQFGLFAVGSIQQRIADGIEPENAESTIARKGSSTPLIDQGILRSSITSKVAK